MAAFGLFEDLGEGGDPCLVGTPGGDRNQANSPALALT